MIRRFSPDRSEREFRWGQVGVVVDGRARARHQRRTEDDGRDLAGADRQRLASPAATTSTSRPGSSSAARRRSRSAPTCGGWRIIKTLGTKVVEVRPPQGFGSETVAATVILASSHVGYPALDHPGGLRRRRRLGRRPPGRHRQLVRRAQHRRSAGSSRCRPPPPSRAVVYAVIDVLGGSAFGVIVVSVALVIGCYMLWRANRAKPVEPEETVSEHPTFGAAPRARRRSRHDLRRRRRLGRAAAGRVRLGRVRDRRDRSSAGWPWSRSLRAQDRQAAGQGGARRAPRGHRSCASLAHRGRGRARDLHHDQQMTAPTAVRQRRPRPIATALDTLRPHIDHDAFDAAVLSLDAVIADLGYGDVRALPGSVAWIDRLRARASGSPSSPATSAPRPRSISPGSTIASTSWSPARPRRLARTGGARRRARPRDRHRASTRRTSKPRAPRTSSWRSVLARGAATPEHLRRAGSAGGRRRAARAVVAGRGSRKVRSPVPPRRVRDGLRRRPQHRPLQPRRTADPPRPRR